MTEKAYLLSQRRRLEIHPTNIVYMLPILCPARLGYVIQQAMYYAPLPGENQTIRPLNLAPVVANWRPWFDPLNPRQDITITQIYVVKDIFGELQYLQRRYPFELTTTQRVLMICKIDTRAQEPQQYAAYLHEDGKLLTDSCHLRTLPI